MRASYRSRISHFHALKEASNLPPNAPKRDNGIIEGVAIPSIKDDSQIVFQAQSKRTIKRVIEILRDLKERATAVIPLRAKSLEHFIACTEREDSYQVTVTPFMEKHLDTIQDSYFIGSMSCVIGRYYGTIYRARTSTGRIIRFEERHTYISLKTKPNQEEEVTTELEGFLTTVQRMHVLQNRLPYRSIAISDDNGILDQEDIQKKLAQAVSLRLNATHILPTLTENTNNVYPS